MGHGNTEVDFTELPVPGKIGVSHLQLNFQVKYELDEKQARALVLSSCESLNEVLSEAHSLLAANDEDMSYELIRGIAHRARGLFLTMGLEKWAGYVVSLKKVPAGKVRCNLQIVVDNVQKNFSDITMLCE